MKITQICFIRRCKMGKGSRQIKSRVFRREVLNGFQLRPVFDSDSAHSGIYFKMQSDSRIFFQVLSRLLEPIFLKNGQNKIIFRCNINIFGTGCSQDKDWRINSFAPDCQGLIHKSNSQTRRTVRQRSFCHLNSPVSVCVGFYNSYNGNIIRQKVSCLTDIFTDAIKVDLRPGVTEKESFTIHYFNTSLAAIQLFRLLKNNNHKATWEEHVYSFSVETRADWPIFKKNS